MSGPTAGTPLLDDGKGLCLIVVVMVGYSSSTTGCILLVLCCLYVY
jgi:hypothetical protein